MALNIFVGVIFFVLNSLSFLRSWVTLFIQFENHIVPAAWRSSGVTGFFVCFWHIEHSVLILPPTGWGSLKVHSALEFQNTFLVRAYFQLSSSSLHFQDVICSLQIRKTSILLMTLRSARHPAFTPWGPAKQMVMPFQGPLEAPG